jgi:ribA/ribD-fused uncharacterized protein
MHPYVIAFFSSTRYGRFLSNFYERPIHFGGKFFRVSSEQVFLYAKIICCVPKDHGQDEYVALLFTLETSLQCKELSNKINEKFSRNVNKFKDSQVAIMMAILFTKFTEHEDLKQELLATGERLLVEASPTDDFWGAGMSERKIYDAVDRYGPSWRPPHKPNRPQPNQLGILLMQLRDHLSKKKPLSDCLLIGDSIAADVDFDGQKAVWRGGSFEELFKLLELTMTSVIRKVTFHGGTNEICLFKPWNNPEGKVDSRDGGERAQSVNVIMRKFKMYFYQFDFSQNYPTPRVMFFFSEILKRHHNGPKTGDLARRSRVQITTDRVNQEIRQMSAEMPMLSIIDNSAFQDKRLFKENDLLHVNKEGARVLSETFARVLAQH